MLLFRQQKLISTAVQSHQSLFKSNTIKGLQYQSINYFSSQQDDDKSFLPKLFRPSSYTNPASTNRWLMAVPAFFAHLCIGGPYAWSIVASTITKEYGVIVSSALDWSLQSATLPLSLCFCFQGLSAAAVGGLQIKYGLRLSLLAASTCYFSGVMLGAYGIYAHSLPLLYLGYGVLAGTGVGTVYTPPVQALMEWFPDRKGLAGGLCITGFGGGALVMGPLVQKLMIQFQKMPEFVGKMGQYETYTESGRLFAKVGSEAREVIIATASDIAKIPGNAGVGLEEGLYAVGTGSTGAAPAIGIIGLIYTATLLTSTFAMKKPPTGYLPEGFDPSKLGAALQTKNVQHTVVMKTPQFYSLLIFLISIATGGLGLMSVSKSMMVDTFSVLAPTIVTTAFATKFVLILSAGNMVGRLGWANLQDKYGSKFVYNAFTGIAIPLYISIPFCINSLVQDPTNTLPLYGFVGSAFFIASIMGGTYSTLPAYEAQIFGAKYVGPIHGKMLLGSTGAALCGPNLIILMRNYEESKAMKKLLEVADPVKFKETFNVGIEKADELIQAKVLTINKLMTMVPPEIQDPSPYLYNSTMYVLTGLAGLAALCHISMGPVKESHFEKVEEIKVESIKSEEQQNKEAIEDSIKQQESEKQEGEKKE